MADGDQSNRASILPAFRAESGMSSEKERPFCASAGEVDEMTRMLHGASINLATIYILRAPFASTKCTFNRREHLPSYAT